MALPSTGGTYAATLQPDLLPTAIRKGIITDILIRDYLLNGVAQNLAATAAGLNTNGVFTPYAQDGQLRTDLLITASGSNQGFFHIGLLKDDGWSFEPDLTVDQTPVAQSPWSARNDVTKITGTMMFAARQWFPLIDYLRMDLPTVNSSGVSVVPDIGTAGYSQPAPAYQNLCERQVIALGFDGATNFSITCTRVSQKKQGKTEANKKNAADHEFNWELLLDPMTSTPYIISFGGAGWLGLGGAPVFGGSPPVATATSSPAHSATVAFTTPTGLDAPFTYTVTQQVGGSGPFTASTLVGSPSVSGATTTITVGSLTASSTYILQVIATGTNNASTTSANSNSITAT